MNKKSVNKIVESPENSPIPEKIILELQEYTNGGFLIFFLDQDGCPQFMQGSENKAYEEALNKGVRMYKNMVEMIEESEIMEAVYSDEE